MKRICPRVSNKPLPNDAKGPLPVDVRRSTTLLLKLPIVSYVMQVSTPYKSYYDIIIVLNLPSGFQSGYYSRASPNSDTVIFQINTFSPET